MKIRSDFVTNSSSSSFVIAQHKDCTLDEIKDKLKLFDKEIRDALECWEMPANESSVKKFINNLSNDLYKMPKELKFGDWSVNAEAYDNEVDEYETFMHDYGYRIETEHFKVG